MLAALLEWAAARNANSDDGSSGGGATAAAIASHPGLLTLFTFLSGHAATMGAPQALETLDALVALQRGLPGEQLAGVHRGLLLLGCCHHRHERSGARTLNHPT